jgi:hypothetical protein
MRGILLGLLILVLPCFATPAFAQATGEVEVIGFNGTFRSTGWTSMVVRLKPQSNEAGNYEIRVLQHDLDGDRPVYVHPISLSGSNQASEQRFWMYFQTEPINNGLGFGITSVKELQKDLTVFLTTPGGKQVVAKLPLTSTVTDIDPVRDPIRATGLKARGTRLVLVVSAQGGKSMPIGDYSSARGVVADIDAISVRPNELPDNPLGYEAVDAVVWLDGDPITTLAGSGSQSLAALQDYVKFGGHLVICQSVTDWQQDASWGDMLPVDVTGVDHKSNMEPLYSMAVPPREKDPFDPDNTSSWASPKGPFLMARAKPRPGATVDNWIDWKQDKSNLDVSPFIARRGWGLGQVTWVAQPMSSDSVPMNPTGWPYVWNHIFGWANDAYVIPPLQVPDDPAIASRMKRYQPGSALDLGSPLTQGLNLGNKTAWLMFLAIVFFLVYWVVAGPGSYIFLAVKKKRGLSWFAFGISALVATAFTIGVVKLVLRGPPEVRHISLVRGVAGQPTIVWSRFGLYIPRDGDQTLSLSGISPSSVSYLSPFPEHPQQLGEVTEFAVPLDYEVPVRELKMDTDPTLTVPYRSSLKKFQARWVGDLPIGFGGLVKLNLSPDKNAVRLPLSGTITNGTGNNLTDVYLVFNWKGQQDWMVYIPTWGAGVSIDIQRDWAPQTFKAGTDANANQARPGAGDGKIISDELAPDKTFTMKADDSSALTGWAGYWFNNSSEKYRGKASSTGDAKLDPANTNAYFPQLSVFSRLPPMPNWIESRFARSDTISTDRVELINRGARDFDMGSAIGAGQLVVLATAAGPLPIDLKVNGTKVAGEGTTFYQFVMPLDRGPIQMPTTAPSPVSAPTTAPAAAPVKK